MPGEKVVDPGRLPWVQEPVKTRQTENEHALAEGLGCSVEDFPSLRRMWRVSSLMLGVGLLLDAGTAGCFRVQPLPRHGFVSALHTSLETFPRAIG